MEITDKRYLWKCIQSSNITQSRVHELLSKTEKRQREKKPSYLHEHCESKHILEYEDHFRHPWGDDVCCSGFFPITNSFCNSSQHAAPVSVPNWPLFLVVFDRPTVLHWKKKAANQPSSHLISQLTRLNRSMSEIGLWSARQQCANNYTEQRCHKTCLFCGTR